MTIFCVVFLSACTVNKTWNGYYYPDKNNIGDKSKWVIQEGFTTLDYCRDWVNNISKGNDNFDYECGYNCTYRENYGMNVCEKTEK